MTPILARRARPDRQFERIYRQHVGDVYRYALAVLRNAADAEDVTQTTFLNAYRAFERGERPETPKNWLIAIAHNVCRQRFRTASRRPNEVELNEEVAPAPEEDEQRYSVEDIQRALGQLAFNQRSALVMRELEGRSYAEIAEILGLTVAAVETLIFRARRALREQLEGALSCAEAELALSRAADGELPRAEKGALRAHLRECKSCATHARRLRAQRGALKALGAAPLPGSLVSWVGSWLGGGAAAGGSAVAMKAAAVTAAGLLVAGGGIEGHRALAKHRTASPEAAAAAEHPAVQAPRPAARAQEVSASPVVRNAAPKPARKTTPVTASKQTSAAGAGAPTTPPAGEPGFVSPTAAGAVEQARPGRQASAHAHAAKSAPPRQAAKPKKAKKAKKPKPVAGKPGQAKGQAKGQAGKKGQNGKKQAPAATGPSQPPAEAGQPGSGSGNGSGNGSGSGSGGGGGNDGSGDSGAAQPENPPLELDPGYDPGPRKN